MTVADLAPSTHPWTLAAWADTALDRADTILLVAPPSAAYAGVRPRVTHPTQLLAPADGPADSFIDRPADRATRAAQRDRCTSAAHPRCTIAGVVDPARGDGDRTTLRVSAAMVNGPLNHESLRRQATRVRTDPCSGVAAGRRRRGAGVRRLDCSRWSLPVACRDSCRTGARRGRHDGPPSAGHRRNDCRAHRSGTARR